MKSQAPSSKSQRSSKSQVPKGVLGARVAALPEGQPRRTVLRVRVLEGRQEGSRCVQVVKRPEPPVSSTQSDAPRQGRQKRCGSVMGRNYCDCGQASADWEPFRGDPAGAHICFGGGIRWFQARCAFHRPATFGSPLRGGRSGLLTASSSGSFWGSPASGSFWCATGLHLGFGAWNFFGAWSLGFGASPS